MAGRLAVLLVAVGGLLAAAPRVASQNVVDVLREQRQRARVAEVLAALGPDVAPRPVRSLGADDPYVGMLLARRAAARTVADSLAAVAARAAADSAAAAATASFRWQKAEPASQGLFLDRYREAYWRAAPLGATSLVDTTATPTLRGWLQNVFGAPTRNADAFRQVGYAGSETVQFEYWFVVNDAIPVLVMDIDGPFGRGLLLASDETHAHLLPALKAALAAELAESLGPDPWVDYYRSLERNQWFRTGYNGTERFTVSIRPPAWSLRPRADRWNIHR